MDTVVADDRPLIQNTDDEDPIGGARVVIKQPKYRKITIEPVALLYFLGIVPQSLVIEQFVYGQFSSKYNFSSSDNQTQCTVKRSDPHYVTQQHIQALTSDWTLYNSLLSTLPAIVTTLFLGPHSDTTSRKLPLLIPLTGMLLANSYYAVVVSLNLDVPYILIGGFLGGLSGGFTTMLMGCFAYTADVSTHKKRTQHIVIMEIIIGTSYSATTVATGYMIKAVGLLWPIIVAIIFLVMDLLYVCLLLPETVARRQAMTSARLCSFSNVFRPFRILTRKSEFKYHRVIVALSLATLSLYLIALIGDTNVNLLYLQNAPLCLGVVVVTIYTAVKFCFPSYCGLIATFLLKNRLKDTGLMIMGCLTGTSGALLFAFSTNIYMVFSVPVASMFMYLAVPMVRSILSKMVVADEQGALFAVIAVIEAICGAIGSPLFNTIYSSTLYVFAGLVYLVQAGIRGVTLLLSIVLLVYVRRYEKEKNLKLQPEK